MSETKIIPDLICSLNLNPGCQCKYYANLFFCPKSNLLNKSKYHELTDLKITKVNNSKTANSQNYKVEAKVAICEEKIALEKRSTGRFFLATNVLNKEELTTEEILSKYKQQKSNSQYNEVLASLKTPFF